MVVRICDGPVPSFTIPRLGKDEYLRRAAFDWVAWYYTVPLAIAVLIAAWTYASRGEK
jgi:hypothetical protein